MKRVLWGLVVVVLLVAIGLQLHWRATAPPPPPTAEEFAALEAERDALQERFRVSVTKAGETSLAKAPRAGVMIGLPTGFARSIVEQVVTGLFGETTLTLRNLKVHKEGDVKAKLLFRKKQVGQFVLDVDIQETKGILKPGKPELSFGHEPHRGEPARDPGRGRWPRPDPIPVGQQGPRGERGLRRCGHHP